MVRVRAAHDPQLAGDRLLGLYQKPVALEPGQVTEADAEGEWVPGSEDAQGPSDSPIPNAPDRGTDAEDRDVRDALVTAHLPLARQLAGWYTGRGQAREDLVQVAYLGLVLAAERFDPAHGTPFHSFAVPTILGELRRHFRDHAWDMRVPRAMQESVLEVRRAADDLQQSWAASRRRPTWRPRSTSARTGSGSPCAPRDRPVVPTRWTKSPMSGTPWLSASDRRTPAMTWWMCAAMCGRCCDGCPSVSSRCCSCASTRR